ncbi:hypothetical protein [Dinghuibacter silviterrae]|uniref:Uncharacterized protein n=1 Tax=Dinghuibacter silviterrae TaxID=1539049 RepID=A0A4R8DRE8_9BACT|nr:hypothetical protein [Dinghuibacter silviterrae]TDW99994.1 hypothetical protein EDB95_1011 [Dinghuibacter silviterrae]
MRYTLLVLCCCFLSVTRAQGPSGYWLSEDKTGFFEGLESVEMRLDPSGNAYSGSVYYLWEHGIYYQAISLEGKVLPGDSVELREVAMVANRNGIFANDCRGVFHLHYRHDSEKEYLEGVWKKPAGSRLRCADTHVTFFRSIPPDAAWNRPAGNAVKRGARVVARVTPAREKPATGTPAAEKPSLAPAAPPAPVVVAPPLNQDSLRFVAFKSRKDSLELTVKHKADTARLELYDNGIVDGDRISLFLGDSLILKNYELLADAHVLTLHLDPSLGQQVLSLYAENLGEIPPNTALMIVYIDDQRYEVRLSSDMTTNARVVFQRVQ